MNAVRRLLNFRVVGLQFTFLGVQYESFPHTMVTLTSLMEMQLHDYR